jgi:hypothetical protein
MGAVKVVKVVVAEVKAVRWKTSTVAALVPSGTEEDAKKAVGSSLTAWKVVVATVVVEKVGGTETVMVESVTVEVAVVLAVVAFVAVDEAWPVQESVVNM